MLGKLIKYEIKATARTFLLLYAAVIALSIINRIFFGFGSVPMEGAFESIYAVAVGAFVMMYVLTLIALGVASLIVVIQRFYKNLFGDEGYLMFTLPVKPWQHIVSKGLTASIWMTASTIVIIISLLVLASVPEVFSGFREGMQYLFFELEALEFSIAPFVIEFVAIMLISTLGYALPIYACISIGQLWKKHRVLGAFLAYFALNFITQIISSIFSVIISIPMLNGMSSNYTPFGESYEVLRYFHSIMIFSIVLTVVFSVVEFFIVNHILEKKLDLE